MESIFKKQALAVHNLKKSVEENAKRLADSDTEKLLANFADQKKRI